jgi:CNT family concentrative nucleoside transporter
MGALNLGSLAGLAVLAALAWAAGGFRRPVPWRTVAGAGALLLAIGALVFLAPPARAGLVALNGAVLAVLQAGSAGARFLFGPLALNPGETTDAGEPSVGFVLAAQVLPAVIFFSALMAALYHVRVMPLVVRVFARLFHRTMGLSGAEALAGSANVFVGVEAAVTVRPLLERMTRSELMVVLTTGMATVASTTLAIYVSFLKDAFPLIAGHLLSASVLAIPAAVLAAKLMVPETGEPATRGGLPDDAGRSPYGNTFGALAAGAWDGLKLAAGIATLLIAVLGVVALADLALGFASTRLPPGRPLDLRAVLGAAFTPLAWLLGIEAGDVREAARLLGERAVLTEVVAYRDLAALAAGGSVSARTVVVLSYALCGFAHAASVGIFVGGTAALAPSRRDELASLGPRAFVAATLATLMTGAVAGVFHYGQATVLGR